MSLKRYFKLAAVVSFSILLLFITAWAAPPKYDKVATPAIADTTTILTGFGKLATFFERTRNNLGMSLQVSGRATNDSLQVTVQSTNVPADTNSWVNLTAFGGVKVANGITARNYYGPAVTADSTFFLGRYVRMMINHGAAAGSSLAGDSSRVLIQIKEWD